ncbi:MAG: ribbon-helix-helix domain-containing protein [Gaiella sp.]|nr:ribbon-helix-helix domain-containing protein [Gaiella sp.]
MAQLVTRIGDSLVERVDSLVAAGVLASRSEAVRLALEHLVDRLERERIGREIVEAYTRMPQTDEEIAWAEEAARRMIAEEPW